MTIATMVVVAAEHSFEFLDHRYCYHCSSFYHSSAWICCFWSCFVFCSLCCSHLFSDQNAMKTFSTKWIFFSGLSYSCHHDQYRPYFQQWRWQMITTTRKTMMKRMWKKNKALSRTVQNIFLFSLQNKAMVNVFLNTDTGCVRWHRVFQLLSGGAFVTYVVINKS